MRLPDGRCLDTATCGVRTKWPLVRRTPLYLVNFTLREFKFLDKNAKNERITPDDQKSTLPEWNIKENFRAKPELRKCDVISPDDSNQLDFESHPACIDWKMIIDQTRSFLRQVFLLKVFH